MSELHPYGSNTKNRRLTFGIIALLAVASTKIFSLIDFPSIIRSIDSTNSTKSSLLKSISNWDISIGLLSSFSLFYFLYDKWIWKISTKNWQISNTPNIAGTWVGFASPNYHSCLHFEIITVEQTWSDICVRMFTLYKDSQEEEWDIKKILGYNYSIASGMTGVSVNEASIVINYSHKGYANFQPDCNVTQSLLYKKLDEELIGTYYTNRIIPRRINNEEDNLDRGLDREGSLGQVHFKLLSKKILSTKDISRKILEIKNKSQDKKNEKLPNKDQEIIDWLNNVEEIMNKTKSDSARPSE